MFAFVFSEGEEEEDEDGEEEDFDEEEDDEEDEEEVEGEDDDEVSGEDEVIIHLKKLNRNNLAGDIAGRSLATFFSVNFLKHLSTKEEDFAQDGEVDDEDDDDEDEEGMYPFLCSENPEHLLIISMQLSIIIRHNTIALHITTTNPAKGQELVHVNVLKRRCLNSHIGLDVRFFIKTGRELLEGKLRTDTVKDWYAYTHLQTCRRCEIKMCLNFPSNLSFFDSKLKLPPTL